MATITLMPTAAPYTSQSVYRVPNTYDNDVNTSGRTSGQNNSGFILAGFDFSSLPNNATINNISIIAKVATQYQYNRDKYRVDITAQICSSATGWDSYVDVGDGAKYLVNGEQFKTPQERTVEFPYAAANISTDYIKSSGILVRFTGHRHGSATESNEVSLYALWLIIDYTVQQNYTITTAVSPTGAGTVSGGGTYSPGSTATLTATAAVGYVFYQWSDGNTSSTRIVTVTGNATYTAQFVSAMPEITAVEIAPNPANVSQGLVIKITAV